VISHQVLFHCFAQQLSVHPRISELGFGILHHGAHVFYGRRAHLGDGGANRGNDLLFPNGLGHVALDDGDLVGLPYGQFVTVALLELVNRVLALLDHGGEDLQLFFFVEIGAFLNPLVLQCRFHHTQGPETKLFFLSHGVDHVYLYLLGQAHAAIIE
jgi:hypothetical protein